MAGTTKTCPVCNRHFEDAEELVECPDDESVLVFETEDPYVGTTVSGRYEVLALIGKGATSTVYKAEDKQLGALVALKILHPHLASEGAVVRRLQQEARSLKELTHENIVKVLNFSMTRQGQPYLALEYLDGANLFEILKHDSESMSFNEKLDIFCQLCDALFAAHKSGIVHRDLKPGNIIILKNEGGSRVKILDFGIAKIFPLQGDTFFRLTQTGEMMGSLLYMSPEQCLEQDWDQKTDIYSLGCVMYELLTGQPPFLGRTAFDTMNKHLSEMPQPLSQIRPDRTFPPGVQNVLWKALAKKSDDRYATVLEFKRDMMSAAKGEDPVPQPSRSLKQVVVREAKDPVTLTRLLVSMMLTGMFCYVVASTAGNISLALLLLGVSVLFLWVPLLSRMLPAGLVNLDVARLTQRQATAGALVLAGQTDAGDSDILQPKAFQPRLTFERAYKDAMAILCIGVPVLLVVPAVVLVLTHQLLLAVWTFYGLVVLGAANLLMLWIRVAGREGHALSIPYGTSPGNMAAVLHSLSQHQRTAVAIIVLAAMAAPLFLLAVKGAVLHAVYASPLVSVALFGWISVSALLLLFSLNEVSRYLKSTNYIPAQLKEAHQDYIHGMLALKKNEAVPLGHVQVAGQGKTRQVFSVRTERPHLLITGLPATGKTSLMASIIAWDIEKSDRSLMVIDKSGSLTDLLLSHVSSQPNGAAIAERMELIDLVEMESLYREATSDASEMCIDFLSALARFNWRVEFKTTKEKKNIVLVRSAVAAHLDGIAAFLMKEYAEAGRDDGAGEKNGDSANSRQSSAQPSAIYVDGIDELIPVKQFIETVSKEPVFAHVFASASSLGYLNSTRPAVMDGTLLSHAKWLGGLCVFRTDYLDGRMVGPSILPKEENAPKPSHVFRLKNGESVPQAGTPRPEWFESDYFPREWERQARLVSELADRTFFFHEIGKQCGVVRLLAHDLKQPSPTEQDHAVLEKIRKIELSKTGGTGAKKEAGAKEEAGETCEAGEKKETGETSEAK